jgi:hypothetical protein
MGYDFVFVCIDICFYNQLHSIPHNDRLSISWPCIFSTTDSIKAHPCGIALIALEVSTTGSSGPWTEIITDIPNNCRYQWSIPSELSSDNCFIRYTAATATDTGTAVTPASFRISPATSVDEVESSELLGISLDVHPTVSAQNVILTISTNGRTNSCIKVYDNAGQIIRKLLEIKGSGNFNIQWDRKDANRRYVPSGTYFITLETKEQSITKLPIT